MGSWETPTRGVPGRVAFSGVLYLLADASTLFTISGFIFEIPVNII